METSRHVLVVDDDAEIRRLLTDFLRKNGYRVTAVANGDAMWVALYRGRVHIVVLDLMLPGENGLELCRTLRLRSQLPVIMLTARGGETDRITGLETGADDYLPKPFNPRELLVRIAVVLRRAHQPEARISANTVRHVRFGQWQLDTVARHLVSPDGVVISLSGAEYRLLRAFLGHPGQVLTRDQLMDFTRGGDIEHDDRSIDVQIGRLRHRLGDHAREPGIIKTVRGEGYVLAAPTRARPK